MKKDYTSNRIKQGTYVTVNNREGYILDERGIYSLGNPTGRVKKVFKYTNSNYKYKVRISPNTYIYCKIKEISNAK